VITAEPPWLSHDPSVELLRVGTLSSGERELLGLLASGCSNQQIAHRSRRGWQVAQGSRGHQRCPADQPVTGLHDTWPALPSIAGPGELVVSRTQAINGVTCTLTCPVVCLEPGQDACGTGRREPEATTINRRPEGVQARHALAWEAWLARLTKVRRFDCFDRVPPVEPAA
jgi:hypothetical protein